MDPIKNLSVDFSSALKTAAKDNVINKNELKELQSKATTDDDKALLEKFTQDKSSIKVNVQEGSAQTTYDLSMDFDEPTVSEPPKEPTKKQVEFNTFRASYASLGEGDKSKASNVSAQPYISKVTGNIDDVAKNFNTPEKVASLLDSIVYDTERGKAMGGDGPLGSQTPEDTLKQYTGVCRDTHQLGAYLLSQNGYEATQVGYVGARTSHSITVYKEPNGKGFGIVEYGKVYSPEKIKDLLGGRYAKSPEEAVNALNFGGATAIYKWTPPKKDGEASVSGVFYTEKYQNYHKSLKLEHQNSLVLDRQLGVQLEKTLGEKFSIKASFNFDSPGDPTAKNASNVAVGYKTGNKDNWFAASMGAQYRPNDGNRIVGTLDWQSTPTLLAGAYLGGQVTPLQFNLGNSHQTKTVVSGELSGAFLALNSEKESDAGSIKDGKKLGYDMDYVSALPNMKINVEQRFTGEIAKNLTYSAAAFAHYDANLAIAGSFMGGNPMSYFNTGANARLTYDNGSTAVSLGGQKTFTQVNNLDVDALGLSANQKVGKFNFYGSSALMNSVEGARASFGGGVGYHPIEKISINLNAQQEIILPKGDSAYTNPSSTNLSIGIKGTF